MSSKENFYITVRMYNDTVINIIIQIKEEVKFVYYIENINIINHMMVHYQICVSLHYGYHESLFLVVQMVELILTSNQLPRLIRLMNRIREPLT